MWQPLHDAWWRLATQHSPQTFSDAIVCSILRAGSLAYGMGVKLRNSAYDCGLGQVRLPCKVISIGNLTMGGTGKTTCAEMIAKKLLAYGQQVAILSRGYGGQRQTYWLCWKSGTLLVNGKTDRDCGRLADEPQILAQRLEGVPVVVGSRRDKTGFFAHTKFNAQTVILDDGFQHRRVVRDCDIVLVHARMPLRGWDLLPRGPMREPLTSLKRAHVIIITKADQSLGLVGALSERLRSLNPEAALVTSEHLPTHLTCALTGEQVLFSRLHDARVGLLSSIGDPEGFEATLRRCEAQVLWHEAYPDHYRYDAADWSKIMSNVKSKRPDAIVTTEKDWVRLKEIVSNHPREKVPVWILGISMHILSGEEDLDARLDSINTH